MILLFVFQTLLIFIYALFFGWLIFGWLKPEIKKTLKEETAISIIIPFRNEQTVLKNLVESFTKLKYNLNIVEFIFIDDHSTDDSYLILNEELKKTTLKYKILKQAIGIEGKKLAIDIGIKHSTHDYIITTDADCTPSKKWLLEYSKAFQDNAEFVIAPIINHVSSGVFMHLQNIEALMLAGVTIGAAKNNTPVICSGANMGYKKSIYFDLNPYQENSTIPSGDDLFFLDEVIASKTPVHTLRSKDALVYTKPSSSYIEKLKQAVRWSSKTTSLKNKRSYYFSLIVFFINLILITTILKQSTTINSLVFITLKFVVDIVFLAIVSSKYEQKKIMLFAPLLYLLYPIHLLIILVAPFFINIQWKGRLIKKDEPK